MIFLYTFPIELYWLSISKTHAVTSNIFFIDILPVWHWWIVLLVTNVVNITCQRQELKHQNNMPNCNPVHPQNDLCLLKYGQNITKIERNTLGLCNISIMC